MYWVFVSILHTFFGNLTRLFETILRTFIKNLPCHPQYYRFILTLHRSNVIILYVPDWNYYVHSPVAPRSMQWSARTDSMLRNGVCKIINFLQLSQWLTLYLRFNSRRASPEIYSHSLYRTGTASSYDNYHNRSCARLRYLTEELASFKKINVEVYLHVRHLWKLQYVYIRILREGAPHKGTTRIMYQRIINRGM